MATIGSDNLKIYGPVNNEATLVTNLYGSIQVSRPYYIVSSIANNPTLRGDLFNSKYTSTYGHSYVSFSKLRVVSSGSDKGVLLDLSDGSSKYLFGYSGTYNPSTSGGGAWGFSYAPASGNVNQIIYYEYRNESRLITKLYGSFNGETKLIYQGIGHIDYGS